MDTRAGIKRLWILEDGRVRVDMGAPIFSPAGDPRSSGRDPTPSTPSSSSTDEIIEAACLSMGNPHAVLFVDEPDAIAGNDALGPASRTTRRSPTKRTSSSSGRIARTVAHAGVGARERARRLRVGRAPARPRWPSRLLRDADERMIGRPPGRRAGHRMERSRRTSSSGADDWSRDSRASMGEFDLEDYRVRTAGRIEKLPPYLFAEIDRKVAEAKARGADIISFGVGDPDLPTPPHVVEALSKRPRGSRHAPLPLATRACPTSARRSPTGTRAASASKLDPDTSPAARGREGRDLPSSRSCSWTRGDVALVPDPGYPVYETGTILAGGEAVSHAARGENGFHTGPGGDPGRRARARQR